jgi:AbrB family looped-hinge helix DNA binding protein
MVARTRITTKGQVVIPKGIRGELQWRPGTHLSVAILPEGGIKLDTVREDGDVRTSPDPIERAFGFLQVGDPLRDLEKEHREEVRADARRRRRR